MYFRNFLLWHAISRLLELTVAPKILDPEENLFQSYGFDYPSVAC